MMFIVKPDESEFWATLEGGMRKNASFEENLEKEQINKAINYLSSAAASLNLVGLKKEAEMVMVLKDVCEGDEATEGLDSETMLKNLAEKGWVFNADDGAFEDEKDDVLEVSYTYDIPGFKTIRYTPEEMEEGWVEAMATLVDGIKESMGKDDAQSRLDAEYRAAKLIAYLRDYVIPRVTGKKRELARELLAWAESLDLDIDRFFLE